MKAILKRPNKKAKIISWNGDLKSVQEMIEGYVEEVYLDNDLLMLVNEDGNLKDLETNLILNSKRYGVLTIKGPVLFVKENKDKTDWTGLNKKDIEKVSKLLLFSLNR